MLTFMWTALLNGLALGIALQLCHRLRQARLAYRPAHTIPDASWMLPVITLTEIGAVIAELCEPNPDWLVVGLDTMAAIIMLLVTLRFHRHHTTPTSRGQLPTSITSPPRYRP